MKRVFIVLICIAITTGVNAQIANPEYIQIGKSPKEFVEWAKSVKKWNPVDAPDFTIASDSIILTYRVSDYKAGTDYIYLFKGGQIFKTLVLPYSLKGFHDQMVKDHNFVSVSDVDTDSWKSVYGYGTSSVDSVKLHNYINPEHGYRAVVVVTYKGNGYELSEGYEMYCEGL